MKANINVKWPGIEPHNGTGFPAFQTTMGVAKTASPLAMILACMRKSAVSRLLHPRRLQDQWVRPKNPFLFEFNYSRSIFVILIIFSIILVTFIILLLLISLSEGKYRFLFIGKAFYTNTIYIFTDEAGVFERLVYWTSCFS